LEEEISKKIRKLVKDEVINLIRESKEIKHILKEWRETNETVQNDRFTFSVVANDVLSGSQEIKRNLDEITNLEQALEIIELQVNRLLSHLVNYQNTL
jgi:hypothetical protein